MTKKLARLIKIFWVIGKYRLDKLIPLEQLPARVRSLLLISPWRLFSAPELTRGQRIRLALQDLGPVFVKLGQILSTRRDLIPDDIALELVHLQDRVPPFCSEEACKIISSNLGSPIEEVFDNFNATPLASASVAQVHSAQLKTGEEIIVKVIRPGIEKTIAQDISLMYLVATAIETYWQDGKRLRPVDVVADYEQTIFDELDLQREAANASQLRRNFSQSPLIYIPKIYWDFTSSAMLVMERIYGIPVADLETLKQNNTNLKALAETGVELFFTQVFRDSFFHADMHPGNIFVNPDHPEAPQYIAVDFGIMGSLSPQDQSYLARNLLAFFNRDYHQVAQLHIDSGWIPESTRVNDFESAIRTVCEPIFEKPLADISFGQFLLRLFQTARRFDMEIQPQLVLLQKTLLNIEGLGRQLYPELDLWSTAHPFLEKWMKDRIAPPGMVKNIQQHLPQWVEQAPEIPKLIHDTFAHLKTIDPNTARPVTKSPGTSHNAQPKGQSKSTFWWGIGCLGIATIIYQPTLLSLFAEIPWQSMLFAAIGLYLLTKTNSGK
ncbi:MAG: ubiquinone biosynthesis regulatory protein kinase UbiB [Gammaproteobacteria bacterium]|nr:MAG: ubiquinone biosynthesis regulatory protein kinase UbiB [Gammaproteobacteria bacterium]